MKILFTSEEIVEICNDSYYSMNLGQHIEKYSYLGEVTCVCYCRTVTETKLPKVDKQSAKFIFTVKETSIRAKLSQRQKNQHIIEECVKSADAVIAHVPSTNSEHAIKAAKRYSIPYMTVVVGCVWDSMWNYDWRGKLMALPEFIKERNQVASSDYALYVTEHFLQQRYPCKGHTEHASNVCIPEVSTSVLERRLDRITSQTDNSPINLITVASVSVRYKGQEYVIQALSKLNQGDGRQYHYYLIGGGDQSFLKSVAQKYHVEGYVHFIGALPHDKVTEVLDDMDIYIQPSKQEGLPRALIEAMSRALPAIGTNIAGIPELLDPHYLVNKGSYKDIVKTLSDRFDKTQMIEQAKRNFNKASEYSINIINARRQAFFDAFINDVYKRIDE